MPLIFQIINKQLVVFIYSAVSGDTSEAGSTCRQHSYITLIKRRLTRAKTGVWRAVFLRLTANKFSYKSIQNQHFQPCWDCWKAEAAITG